MGGLRFICGLLIAGCVGGCSSLRPWLNDPLPENPPPRLAVAASSGRDPTILVAVTLSGGGARAAAFGYGVLTELHRTQFQWNGRTTDLLDATDVISGVSGGSILAAYYASFGAEKLPDFERDFLRQNFQNSLILQALRPTSLWDLSSPWYGRSHLLARRLDEIYEGKTYADIESHPRHPQLVIAATDMSLGTPFEFTQDQFELICSDLQTVPLSFAVAASSAVPILLSPMTLKNHAQECRDRGIVPRLAVRGQGNYRARMFRMQANSYLDAQARPFIHLVDGGVADNLAVRRLLDRALLGGGLRESFDEVGIPRGSVRKLVLISVNSARDPSNNVDTSDRLPRARAVADTLLFGAGARAVLETQEFLLDTARQWREDLKSRSRDGSDAFAPDAEIHVVQVNLRDAADGELRHRLLQVPTAFSITDEEVTRLIDAGRSALQRSPEFQALRNSLNVQGD
ncbi:patatin-like phospholipase family protein [Variovorax sp. J22R115]|uniref:patatin-like phospholipase family protein n=1 Tax=Variovorax sp. J22R115 TaxID=3053509 RepID=UPI002575164F|nr:patatin-like phospholipase family protein [Variovorax sp. J22R115]MDM0048937.1 patatin-like phospholipase family protein [Variovorax sp. J22R115]